MRQKVSLFFAVLPFQIRNPVRMPPEVSRDELRTKQKILAGVAGGICEQVSGGAAIFLRGPARESSHGLATRVNALATKTKAPAREIPPATRARYPCFCGSWRVCDPMNLRFVLTIFILHSFLALFFLVVFLFHVDKEQTRLKRSFNQIRVISISIRSGFEVYEGI